MDLSRIILVFCVVVVAKTVCAVSAAGDCVNVAASSPAVCIDVDGSRFDVYALKTENSFGTDVFVSAMSGWSLVSSASLQMRGGDTAVYTVRRPPEDTRSGAISFHEYFITTNQKDGKKDVTVPFGQNVIYTAQVDGGARKSNWTVNRQTKYQSARIVFNRNWWNVPSWFIPSVDTVKPDRYYVNAYDSDRSLLRDQGCLTVVGVSPDVNYETSDAASWEIDGVLYVRKGCQLTVCAFPDPNASEWPDGAPIWTEAIPRRGACNVATVDTSQARQFEITVSCGKSKAILPVVVYECKFSLYVKSPSGDAPISFTYTPSSSDKFTPDVGHTSWKMEVCPAAAKRYVEFLFGEDVAKYLNVCVGYYPKDVVGSTGTSPGCLVLNDKSAGVSKTYDITLSQLEKGLYETYRIDDEPGTYVLGTRIYVEEVSDDGAVNVIVDCTYSSDRNCTSVCLGVMGEMGLRPPTASTSWGGETKGYYIIYEGSSPWTLARTIREGAK